MVRLFFSIVVMPQETKQVIAPCILVIKLNLCDSKTKRGEQKMFFYTDLQSGI